MVLRRPIEFTFQWSPETGGALAPGRLGELRRVSRGGLNGVMCEPQSGSYQAFGRKVRSTRSIVDGREQAL